MKTIINQPFGGDGATVSLGTDGNGNLTLSVNYPLAKLTAPLDTAIDNLVQKLESSLGGTMPWLSAVLDPLDAAAKAELSSLLGS